MSTFGDKIFQARKARRLTLSEVGQMVGLPESSVQRYEKGIYPNPNRQLILSFSRELSIPLNELMGWTDGDNDEDIYLLTRNISSQGIPLSSKTTQILRFILEDCDDEDDTDDLVTVVKT